MSDINLLNLFHEEMGVRNRFNKLMSDTGRLGAGVLLAAFAALAACTAPKYVKYVSPSGDFTCDVPWGWAVYIDEAGSDYMSATFTGPMDPEFLRGTPSLTIRWYAYKAVHRLPDGTIERYASAEDYKSQMLHDVYGPACPAEPDSVEDCAYTKAGSDLVQALAASKGVRIPDFSVIKAAGAKAAFYVVYRNRKPPKSATLGVVQNPKGGTLLRQRHAYVVVPMRGGFYALIYPATRDGFEKYKDDFWRMVNSFSVLKEGPAGPLFRP